MPPASDARLTGRARAGLAGLAATGVAAAGLAVALSAPPAVPAAIGAGSAALLAAGALADWTFGLCAFTAWLAAGDLLRKFGGNSLVVLGATELIAVAAIARFAWAWHQGLLPRLRTQITTPLVVLALWTLARAVPGLLSDPLVALNGVHAWLLFTPFLYAGYAMHAGDRDAGPWAAAVLTVGTLAAAGGLLQLALGLEVLNPSDTGGLLLKVLHSSDETDPIPRPNSVFMHAGRFSGTLLAVLWLVPMAAARVTPAHRGRRLALRAAVALVLTGLVLSGQRATLVCLIAGGVLMAIAAAPHLRQIHRLRHRLLTGVAAGAVLLAAAGWLAPNGLAQYYGGLFSPSRIDSTIEDLRYTTGGMRYALETTFWGHGTGAASTGRAYALGVPWDDDAVMPLEGGTGVLLWEWGPAGLALWVWLVWTIARELWRGARTAASPADAGICAGALAAVVTSMGLWFHLTVSAYQSYPLQALLWLTVGGALAAGDRPGPGRARSGTAG
ncbi:MAG: hypothetical protein AB7P67_02830 [Vicinamibacterales bacterium]